MFYFPPSPLRYAWFVRFGAMFMVLLGVSAHLHAQCANPANAIVAENCLTGSPSSEWDTDNNDAGDSSIQGFATDISVNRGGTIYFKIDTPATSYTIDIYRMGYYGGMGARKVTSISPSVPLPQTQPPCFSDPTVGLTDCGTWAVSASWQVPATAVSGVYFAHLVRTDTGAGSVKDSHIVFIVRDDSSHSDILYQTSDTTWQAYNYYGNGSLYGAGVPVFGLDVRAYQVSYNRPVLTRGFAQEAATFVFGAEFAMIQWLESNGYDISYSSGVDTVRNGALIKNHKVFMDSGHDEYVSGEARANIEAARDAGVNLAFFSGNEVFWKTRWQNSSDGSNTPYRTIVCYKETLAFAKLDPADPPTWTGTWRDPSFSPPADGGRPENALTGTIFMVNGTADDNLGNQSITVPAEDGKMRFWRNTAIATLAPGTSYTLVPGSLGYEWDVDADNGFRPAGAFRLSTTTYTLTTDYLLDYGATYGAGTATHHMMSYRAPSGALVFSSGTIDWAFGLSSNHDNPFNYPTPAPDINMQQAAMNLFADMGVQPTTMQPGLVAASKSTDTVPPHSSILAPVVGAAVSTGSSITVSGNASDTGGVVAGVEVSTDGGTTWHPANGRSTWTYSWTPNTVGSITLLSRAVDDTGNLETPTDGVAVSVAPQTCPCTIFGQNTPAGIDSGDVNAVELGLKFRADSDGSILGVRFYKAAANTGTHIGHVWTDTGQLLGTVTFSAEPSSGWVQANFSTPIAATANTTYVVSYYAPAGHYSADSRFFIQSGYDDPPLHALADGVDGSNGAFVYGTGGGFPTSDSNATNYWVDVIYSSSNTYSISGSITGPGGNGALVSITGPESLSTSADASGNFSFSGVVNGTYTVVVSNPGVTFTPSSQTANVNFGNVTGVNFAATVTNPLSISGTISGGAGVQVALTGAADLTTTADASGNYAFNGLLSGSYTVTPSQPSMIFNPMAQTVTLSGSSATNVNFTGQVCACISLWQPTDVPDVVDSGDVNAVEVGVRFTADNPAYILGLRFYKASTNTGTHVGHLWSSTGQLLGTATFPNETSSGWQQGYFSSPVLIDSGTAYIASYLAPNGHYSASASYFAGKGVDRPPLHAPADGVSGPNGVYLYSSTGGFPTGSYSSTNYWVDVLYAAQPHNISGTITGAGGAGATVTLSGSSQMTTTADSSGNFTFTNVLAGSYSITPSQTGYVFVPGNQNVTLSQTDLTGVSFSVPSMCPCDTIWAPSAQPTQIDVADTQSVEVGVKIHADNDGYILGVRFYKASTNGGTHIGNLWSATGALLGTGTFTNESASGWQQLMFANPIPVVANTTYVVSYLAPLGHYSGDGGFFATKGVDSPPLHALQDGEDGGDGVFFYGTGGTFPTGSFGSTNYWVDAIYATSSTYSIAGTISGLNGALATVALSGASSATVTTDATGNFSFSGLANGTYVVTPSYSGFTFSPASQTVTVTDGHALGVSFTASGGGHDITGTITGPGASGTAVTLTGPVSRSATTSSTGTFTFSAVPDGTYTVAVSQTGFTYTPSSQSVVVSGANATVSFVSATHAFALSGTITGPGASGATITLSGASQGTTTSNASGAFSFPGLVDGTYTVVVTSSGFAFTPASQNVTINEADASITFSSAAQTFSLSGTISGAGGNGATITVTGTTNATTTANASGAYTISGLAKGTYTVTPSKTGYTFTPANQSVMITSSSVTANFSTVQAFGISGTISGTGGNGATVTLTGAATATATANSSGAYSFTGLAAGTYTVTPTKSGYTYSPTSQKVTITASNVTANFSSTSKLFTISGTISGAGGNSATVTLSGTSSATTKASTTGAYSFTGMPPGSYTVTPAKTGFLYTPPTQMVILTTANATANFATQTFTISGTISGTGGNGATVRLTGAATATVTANASGTFTFTGLSAGSYTMTPSKTGYAFSPSNQKVTITNANVTTSFATETFSISGTISGAGGNGATVKLSGAATATVTASTSGAYSFTGLTSGSYKVTPSESGHSYTPSSTSVNLSTANVTANFTSK